MLPHSSTRKLLIPLLKSRNDHLVSAPSRMHSLSTMEQFADISSDLDPKGLIHHEKTIIPCQAQEKFMKPNAQRNEPLAIPSLDALLRVSKNFFQCFDIRRSRILYGPPDGIAINDLTELKYVPYVLFPDLWDKNALLRNYLEEALGLQMPKRFTYGRPARAKRFGQLNFTEDSSRFPSIKDNEILELLVDLLTIRRTDLFVDGSHGGKFGYKTYTKNPWPCQEKNDCFFSM